MKWKAATSFLAGALIMLLASVLLFIGIGRRATLRRPDSASVVTEVKQLKELSTVRYSIQRVVGLTEPKVPLGSDSILLMVQGEVIAGVDLAEITSQDIHLPGKNTVSIHLPPARIFSAYLDEKETKIWDRHVTWWTPWVPYDPDLEHNARLLALNDVKDTALKMGILTHAQDYARRAIRDLLAAFGLQANFPDQAT